MEDEKRQSSFQVSDRRFWVEDESALEKSAAAERRYPSYVEELKARTEAAEAKLQERIAQLEEENAAFRERLRGEVSKRVDKEKLAIFREFLEIADNLERALEAGNPQDPGALREGVQLTLELFRKTLRALGVKPLEVLGEPFDPHTAEAVGVIETEDAEKDQTVLEVVQAGYRYGDDLLRPARVRVGRTAGH